jgi:hypothetical protein
LIWGSLAAVMFLLAALPPTLLERMPWAFCPFRRLTGLPCCLCGGTHAMQALVRGDWRLAWHDNPLAAGIGVGAGLYLAYAVVAVLSGRRWRPAVRPRRVVSILFLFVALAAVVNWAYLIFRMR